MNRTQEDTLTMWTTTNAVLNKNTEIWSEAKAFANAVAIFRKIRLEIDPEANMQRTDIPGITEEKTQERIRLNALAKQMALNIEAYAFNKKDIILLSLSVFIVMLSLSRGKTNILYGTVLLVNLAAYIFTVIVP